MDLKILLKMFQKNLRIQEMLGKLMANMFCHKFLNFLRYIRPFFYNFPKEILTFLFFSFLTIPLSSLFGFLCDFFIGHNGLTEVLH